MKINYVLSAALIGTSVALMQPQVLALSSQEVNKIAAQITVQIESEKSPGSGIIVEQDGNTYTVLTCKHVVAQPGTYTIVAPDGARYPIDEKSVKKLKSGLDLAMVTFSSNKNYTIAKLGNSNNATGGTRVYVYGFPLITSTVDRRLERLIDGLISANASQPLPDGYALLYTNKTLEGMSGSPVLNEFGEVIGVHGRSETDNDQSDPTKTVETGFNLGIPINSFLSATSSVNLPNRPTIPRPATTAKADDFIIQGEYKRNKGDYKGAIADYNSALRIDGKNAIAYNNRGVARYLLKDNSGAIADYNLALRFNPNFAKTYNNRGLARYVLGDKQGAITDYNLSLRLDPKFALAYNNRGLARSDLGDKQGAITDYNLALRFDPKLATAYYNRALARYDLGDNQGAIVDNNSALRIDPKFALAYNNRGLARSKLGDKQGAIADYNSALRFDPKLATAYYNRGLARYDSGDNQGAIVDYDSALRLDSKLALAYNNRGLARAELGDTKGAIADYDSALRFDPKLATAYYNRGTTHYDLGDHKAAIADYDSALRINPNMGLVYNNRGLARYYLGDKQGALTDLQKAASLARQQKDTSLYQTATNSIKTLGL